MKSIPRKYVLISKVDEIHDASNATPLRLQKQDSVIHSVHFMANCTGCNSMTSMLCVQRQRQTRMR